MAEPTVFADRPDIESIAHGGDLSTAVRRYGHPRDAWLDLSTGISPHAYPVAAPAPSSWQRLPDDDDDLAEIAAAYYGSPHALPTAGSQDAIRLLPMLLHAQPGTCTAIAALTYGEYRPAFERAGHRVLRYSAEGTAGIDAMTQETDPGSIARTADFTLHPHGELPAEIQHMVLVNPNNPGAERHAPEIVMQWQAQLAKRGGSLIVDEAFADVAPELSIARHSGRPGLIVLRSLGKFFGLAGARVGFVLAEPDLLRRLSHALGAWRVSGPARAAARAALLDRDWQEMARRRLQHDGARLHRLLIAHGHAPRGTALFAWIPCIDAAALQDHLARHAIWVRRFETPASLRFGLPADEDGWSRLDQALAAWQPLRPDALRPATPR